jgi:pyruvate dehydrogenase E2 component (dihydrolipoamide acetyltransferase)
MENGSIAKWSLKEGDKFSPGTAICDVETDKATVTYEATEEGYLAKILVGSGDVKVGQPLMVTVEDASHISAFANFSLKDQQVATPAKPASQPAKAEPAPKSVVTAPTPVPEARPTQSGDRVFASPFARKLARDNGIDISKVRGTGPKGRVVAEDVMSAPKHAPESATVSASPSKPTTATQSHSAPSSTSVPGVYADFELSDVARAVAQRMTASKQHVPHYYVSIDINMSQVLKIRAQLNSAADIQLSVLDFTVKAAALAMNQVPDLNGSWQETFVRRYEQVDINLVMGSGAGLVTPVIRDAGGLGLKAISSVSLLWVLLTLLLHMFSVGNCFV